MADEKIIFSMVGVSKTFTNQKKVLNNIYLSFFYGAKIGIIGLNGSGQSTLLKIIAGDVYKRQVAAQGVGQGDDRRQGVGGGGQRDEQAQVACGGSAPPQPAVVYDVCGRGRERQNRSKPEKHTLF